MEFIRNCWYVIAWDHEIPHGGLFTRTVLGQPIVLLRTAAGEVIALEDRCPHRGAPLSKGRREGDAVRCGYHGIMIDAASGQCIEVPGMARAPDRLCVRRYPVAVQRHWVFVWMGDDAKADKALLPDNFSSAHPDYHYLPGYLHYDTSVDLICDNLLDFTHLSYVHEKTLGGSTAIALARPQIEPVVNGMPGLRVTRHVADVPPPPYYRRMRSFPGNVNRWFIYDFVLPGTLLMHSGGRPVEDAPGDESRTVRLHSCQSVTPETATTTHYFFQQALQGESDPQIVQGIFDSLITAFNEDRDMITAQARNLEREPGRALAPLHFDAALMQFRKLWAQALAAERNDSIPS
jgi:vanillate O-demethylase monooxygenase subunit